MELKKKKPKKLKVAKQVFKIRTLSKWTPLLISTEEEERRSSDVSTTCGGWASHVINILLYFSVSLLFSFRPLFVNCIILLTVCLILAWLLTLMTVGHALVSGGARVNPDGGGAAFPDRGAKEKIA